MGKKQKTLPIRVDDELYAWLKDYADRKHSKMATVITGLLVHQKEQDELQDRTRTRRASAELNSKRRKV